MTVQECRSQICSRKGQGTFHIQNIIRSFSSSHNWWERNRTLLDYTCTASRQYSWRENSRLSGAGKPTQYSKWATLATHMMARFSGQHKTQHQASDRFRHIHSQRAAESLSRSPHAYPCQKSEGEILMSLFRAQIPERFGCFQCPNRK